MNDAATIAFLCTLHVGGMLVLVRLLAGAFAEEPEDHATGEDPPGGSLVDPAHRRPLGPGPKPRHSRRPGPGSHPVERRRDPHRRRRSPLHVP